MKNDYSQPLYPDPSAANQRNKSTEINLLDIQLSHNLAAVLSRFVSKKAREFNCPPEIIVEQIIKEGMTAFEDDSNNTRFRAKIQANKKTPLLVVEEKDDPEDAFIAVKAQQMAYQQLNDAYGYTPLTTHAVGNSKNVAETAKKSVPDKYRPKKGRPVARKNRPKSEGMSKKRRPRSYRPS